MARMTDRKKRVIRRQSHAESEVVLLFAIRCQTHGLMAEGAPFEMVYMYVDKVSSSAP